jgi:hypothetical protein
MGFFKDIKDWMTGRSEAERIEDLAEEVDRHADRFDNAKMAEEAATARDFAERIRDADTLTVAEKIFEQFEEFIEAQHHHHYEDQRRDDDRDDISSDGTSSDDDAGDFSDDS